MSEDMRFYTILVGLLALTLITLYASMRYPSVLLNYLAQFLAILLFVYPVYVAQREWKARGKRWR